MDDYARDLSVANAAPTTAVPAKKNSETGCLISFISKIKAQQPSTNEIVYNLGKPVSFGFRERASGTIDESTHARACRKL
jgi:hypothetical protein